MSDFQGIVQSAVEKLMEDERLRANLTDDEASLLVNWAIGWLESRVTGECDTATAHQTALSESKRLRSAMQKINDTLKSPTLAAANVPLDRQALIREMIAQFAESWREQ